MPIQKSKCPVKKHDEMARKLVNGYNPSHKSNILFLLIVPGFIKIRERPLITSRELEKKSCAKFDTACCMHRKYVDVTRVSNKNKKVETLGVPAGKDFQPSQ